MQHYKKKKKTTPKFLHAYRHWLNNLPSKYLTDLISKMRDYNNLTLASGKDQEIWIKGYCFK